MSAFKTSIRIDGNVFGAVISPNGDLMISLDGTFVEGTIVLKMSQESWGHLCEAVMNASIHELKKKGVI